MPLLTIVLWAFGKQDVEDLVCGLLGEGLSCTGGALLAGCVMVRSFLALSLALALNGVITNLLKIAVGR